jgi:hypothetical protein
MRSVPQARCSAAPFVSSHGAAAARSSSAAIAAARWAICSTSSAGTSSASATPGVRRFYELLAAEPRLNATAIQTVGAKGHDGFALALVVSS